MLALLSYVKQSVRLATAVAALAMLLVAVTVKAPVGNTQNGCPFQPTDIVKLVIAFVPEISTNGPETAVAPATEAVAVALRTCAVPIELPHDAPQVPDLAEQTQRLPVVTFK